MELCYAPAVAGRRMTPDDHRAWDRECDEYYAGDLLEETLVEIAAAPVDVQEVLPRLLHHHLESDFSANVEIVNDEPGSIELFHRHVDPEHHSLS